MHNRLLYFFLNSLLIYVFLTYKDTCFNGQLNEYNFYFQVPFVPFVPCCSIFINLFLMLQLDMFTWMRFAVWMVIGKSIK